MERSARIKILCLPPRSKHHAVYVAGVNGALSKHPEFEKLDIVAVLKQAADMPADIKTAVRNHGAARLRVAAPAHRGSCHHAEKRGGTQ